MPCMIIFKLCDYILNKSYVIAINFNSINENIQSDLLSIPNSVYINEYLYSWNSQSEILEFCLGF